MFSDITLDVSMVLILYYPDGGTEFGEFTGKVQKLDIKSATNDKDIEFKGVDSNSEITELLTLDMSDLDGKALFNVPGVSQYNSRIFW